MRRPCYTKRYADVVELVDTHALGACAARREGSSPFIRTRIGIFPEMSLSWAIFSLAFFNSCHRQKPLSAPALEVVFGTKPFGVWVRVLLYNERAKQFISGKPLFFGLKSRLGTIWFSELFCTKAAF